MIDITAQRVCVKPQTDFNTTIDDILNFAKIKIAMFVIYEILLPTTFRSNYYSNCKI